MKSIGGYLGMEFREGAEYHDQLLKLNTGRNAFEYILRAKNYKLAYLPYYACDALMEPIRRLGIKHVFYSVDEFLDPVIDFKVNSDECFLYINYYGVKDETVERLVTQVDNLIIDNSQAFFAKPLAGTDTFYSCRKFFGVPDGAYLSVHTDNKLQVPEDTSYTRCVHLLKSIDRSIEEGFRDFLHNEAVLGATEIRQMSLLTQTIMCSADYVFCMEKRNKNFQYLHERLEHINELKLNFKFVNGAFSYPLLISDPQLRQMLINERIYIPDNWPSVRKWMAKGGYEYFLSECLVALPLDQRYDEQDMSLIVETINKLT